MSIIYTPLGIISNLINNGVFTVEGFLGLLMVFVTLVVSDKMNQIRMRNLMYKKYGRLRLGTL